MSEYVYIISHFRTDGTACGPIKVGLTRAPCARLATIQTGNPSKVGFSALVLLPSREVAAFVEAECHSVIGWPDARMTGEWFDASPDFAVKVLCGVVENALQERYEDAKECATVLSASGIERYRDGGKLQ